VKTIKARISLISSKRAERLIDLHVKTARGAQLKLGLRDAPSAQLEREKPK
jgi:hypothetical protein